MTLLFLNIHFVLEAAQPKGKREFSSLPHKIIPHATCSLDIEVDYAQK